MLHVENWDAVRAHYRAFWAMENELPILSLRGSRGPAQLPEPPADQDARWLDTEYVLRRARAQIESTRYFGDAFPSYSPNLGPDIFGVTFGGELVFEETTSYAVPFIRDWNRPIVFREDNPWWRRIAALTEAAVRDAKGDYLVGLTDIHSGVDALVSMRGPQDLALDVIDNPEIFEMTRRPLFDAYQKQITALHDLTQKCQKGSTCWMGLYCEELWYPTSCDFICMISREDFARHVLPGICQELDFLGGRSLFHLDGPGALRHLDALLEIPNLGGIQWVFGAGQPEARHWLPVYRKIQAAGKRCYIPLTREDVDPIFETLSPRGLYLTFGYDVTAEEAAEIQKKAERAFAGKR